MLDQILVPLQSPAVQIQQGFCLEPPALKLINLSSCWNALQYISVHWNSYAVAVSNAEVTTLKLFKLSKNVVMQRTEHTTYAPHCTAVFPCRSLSLFIVPTFVCQCSRCCRLQFCPRPYWPGALHFNGPFCRNKSRFPTDQT